MADTNFSFLDIYGYEEDEDTSFSPSENYSEPSIDSSKGFSFLDTYGYEEKEQPVEEEDPGFFERMGAATSGVIGGFAETGALAAGALGFDEVEASLLETGAAFEEDSKIKAYESLYGNEGLEQFGNMLFDGGWWKNTAAALLPGSAPFLAGAATGGLVGSTVPVVGTMIGAMIGGSLALMAQSTGQNYYDELERNGGDEDGARDYALLKTGAEVVINAASIPLGAASAGMGFAATQTIKTNAMTAILKFTGTEVLTENVDTVVGNLIDQAYVDADIDWTRGMAEATAGGLLFDAPAGIAAGRQLGKKNLSDTPDEIADGLDNAQQEAMNESAAGGGDALDQINAAAKVDPRKDPNIGFGTTVDENGNPVLLTREQLIAQDQADTSENALLVGDALEQRINDLQNPVTETLSIPGLAEKRKDVNAPFPLTRGMQQLSGAPTSKTFKPNQTAINVADEYRQRTGLGKPELTQYKKIDKEFSVRIAEAFEQLEHTPNDPIVKEAYEALITETLDQYKSIVASGLKIEFIQDENPYASPSEAIKDVTENNHLYVYSTKAEGGFGSDQTFDPSNNPLLAETEFQISGQPALANDIFRVVHDYFGHVKNGVGFRAEGEENAWQAHAGMYSDLARRAMTTETRGQNSWVNFGPFGEQNRTASSENTIYADQKIGLLPEWASSEGALADGQQLDTTEPAKDEAGSGVLDALVKKGENANGEFFETVTEGVGSVRISQTGNGVFIKRESEGTGKKTDTILNLEGDMADAKDINRNEAETEDGKRPYIGTPESRQFIGKLLSLGENITDVSDEQSSTLSSIVKRLVLEEITLDQANSEYETLNNPSGKSSEPIDMTQFEAAERYEAGKILVQRENETDAAYAKREAEKDTDFDKAVKQKNEQSITESATEIVPETKPLTPMQEAMELAKAKKAKVDAAANEAATSPLNELPIPSQKVLESGDYKKGQIEVQGLDIEIENPKGSERSGVNADGKKWSVKMKNHYGSLKRTEGADGDAIDVFTGNNLESDKVFVIDQIDQKDGTFDEHKVMMGFNNLKTAKLNYKRNYEDGWKTGPVTEMTIAEFKTWVKQSNTKLPVDESVELKNTEEQQSLDFDAKPKETKGQQELALPAPKTDAEVLREKGQAYEEKMQRPTRFSLTKSKREGYEGNDKGESVEWLRAKEKGLPMDKPARMKRAKKLKFNIGKILYHGTQNTFSKFRVFTETFGLLGEGVYLTENAEKAGGFSDGSGANVVQVIIRGRLASNEDIAKLEKKLAKKIEAASGYKERKTIINDALKAKGFDGIDIGSEVLIFDSVNIRSTNAAFDPDFKDSGDLLSNTPDAAEPPKGVSVDKAQAAVKPLQDEMKALSNDTVAIYGSLSEAPQALQDALKAEGRENSKGVFHDGKVHIFAARHATEADVVKTFLHETVVHTGLRKTIPDLDGLLTEIQGGLENQAGFKEIVEKYDLDITNAEERLEATEEYIAKLAEDGLDSPILQKVIDFVRKQLRKLGLTKQWTDADIKSLIRETSKALRGKPLNKVTVTTDAIVAETGETVKIWARADVAIRQIDKRVDICKKLKACL